METSVPGSVSGSLGGRSRWADLGGPVHYLDFGGPAGAPRIVCVHGLGGAAVNWSAIAPLLARRFRLIAPDLGGHGLTRRSRRQDAEVPANRVLLDRFLAAVCGGPVILMGNSMGGMISLLEASAAPRRAAGLILLDPALPFVPARPDPLAAGLFAAAAVPGLGSLLLRHRPDPEALVAGALGLCCADPSRVPPETVAQHVRLARLRAEFPGGQADLIHASRSVMATLGPVRGRAYRHAVDSVSCPVLVIHGDRDRLIPVAVARAAAHAHPAWALEVLPGVGHVPQLEAPADTARLVTAWLAGPGAAAAAAARAG